jgi:phosphoribosyl 1,2-cyclic phosphate phosphodiesterase
MVIYAEQRVLDEVQYRFEYAFTEQVYPGAPRFELRPIHPGDMITVGDIQVNALRVHHGNLPILAYRIGRWAYLTDTNEIPDETFEDLEDLDVLIIDALRRKGHHSHFSLSESIKAVKRIAPKRAYFIHMSHLLGPTAEWEQDLPLHVYPSYDGLQFEL